MLLCVSWPPSMAVKTSLRMRISLRICVINLSIIRTTRSELPIMKMYVWFKFFACHYHIRVHYLHLQICTRGKSLFDIQLVVNVTTKYQMHVEWRSTMHDKNGMCSWLFSSHTNGNNYRPTWKYIARRKPMIEHERNWMPILIWRESIDFLWLNTFQCALELLSRSTQQIDFNSIIHSLFFLEVIKLSLLMCAMDESWKSEN